MLIGIPVLAIAWWLGSPLFIDAEVNEEFPMSAGAIVPDDMTQEQVEAEMLKAADEPDTESSESMPGESPIAILTGQFEDFDNSHRGSGTATVYDVGAGELVLRLEDFDVTNGPDLHVLLVPDVDPKRRNDVTGYVDLGPLKGNVGDQNYAIPDGLSPGDYGSVVIYCVPFHVIFSVASLG